MLLIPAPEGIDAAVSCFIFLFAFSDACRAGHRYFHMMQEFGQAGLIAHRPERLEQ